MDEFLVTLRSHAAGRPSFVEFLLVIIAPDRRFDRLLRPTESFGPFETRRLEDEASRERLCLAADDLGVLMTPAGCLGVTEPQLLLACDTRGLIWPTGSRDLTLETLF